LFGSVCFGSSICFDLILFNLVWFNLIWLFGESNTHNLVSSPPFDSSDCIALRLSPLLIRLIDYTSPPIDSSH